MTLSAKLAPGVHLHNHRTGPERLIDKLETVNQVVSSSFKHPLTGEIEYKFFSLFELESHFRLLTAKVVAFRIKRKMPLLVAEFYRLCHAHFFNRLFATDASLSYMPLRRYTVTEMYDELSKLYLCDA